MLQDGSASSTTASTTPSMHADTPPMSPSSSPKPNSRARLAAIRPSSAHAQEDWDPSVRLEGAVAQQCGSQRAEQQHIWVITGPAGCGKSTVAAHLATTLNLPFLEGDEYHPPANIQKMSHGIPLTDADRWDWLTALRRLSVSTLISTSAPGVVLTCSCLKQKYRDVLRLASYNKPNISVHFVFLRADESVLLERVRARQGHFMKDAMVHSQFADLEEPDKDEMTEDCLVVDVSGQPTTVMEMALETVKGVLEKVAADTASH